MIEESSSSRGHGASQQQVAEAATGQPRQGSGAEEAIGQPIQGSGVEAATGQRILDRFEGRTPSDCRIGVRVKEGINEVRSEI